MSTRVVVTGAGLVSALGDTPQALHRALLEGRSGLGPIELFETGPLGPLHGGEIKGFAPQDYLGKKNFRPLNRIAQITAAAAQQTLKASGWSVEAREQQEVGFVLGTMFCSVHTITAFDRHALTAGPSYASPLDFANTVINAAAGQTAIWHGLRGVNSTIATGPSSGLQALGYAADLIRTGRAKALLAGGAEELCFESAYGLQRAGLLADTVGAARPFDARRGGFAVAEGAAFLMLEELASARQRGAQILAEIKGHASGYDISRGQDQTKVVEVLSRTLCQALENAGIQADQVDAVSASANGSQGQDRCEALALAEVFEARPGIPVTAIKAALGESLGAGGALQAVDLLETMEDGVLPGVAGFERGDADAPLKGVSRENRPVDLGNGLLSATGFDGHCAALILGRPEGI